MADGAGQPDTQSYYGVIYDTQRKAFKVRIHYGGQERFVGRYKSKRMAALAYDQAARYINNQTKDQEGVESCRKRSRLRGLNFPDLYHDDPDLAVRLHKLFAAAAGQAAGSCRYAEPEAAAVLGNELPAIATAAPSDAAAILSGDTYGEEEGVDAAAAAAAAHSPTSWAVLAFTGALGPAAAYPSDGLEVHLAEGGSAAPYAQHCPGVLTPAAEHSGLTGGSSTACPPSASCGEQPGELLYDDSISQHQQEDTIQQVLQSVQHHTEQLPQYTGQPAGACAGNQLVLPASVAMQHQLQQQASGGSASPQDGGVLPQHMGAAAVFAEPEQLQPQLQPQQRLLLLLQQEQQQMQQQMRQESMELQQQDLLLQFYQQQQQQQQQQHQQQHQQHQQQQQQHQHRISQHQGLQQHQQHQQHQLQHQHQQQQQQQHRMSQHQGLQQQQQHQQHHQPLAVQDPCSMPLTLVDALGDEDWTQLLATVGSNSGGSAHGGSSTHQGGSSSRDSAPLLQLPHSYPSSSAPYECVPVGSGLPSPASQQGYDSSSGGGSRSSMVMVGSQGAGTRALAAVCQSAPLPALDSAAGAGSMMGRQWPASHMLGLTLPTACNAVLLPASVPGAVGTLCEAAAPAHHLMQQPHVRSGPHAALAAAAAATLRPAAGPAPGAAAVWGSGAAATGPGPRQRAGSVGLHQGFFSHIQSPAQALALTSKALQLLKELVSHLQQQLVQQPQSQQQQAGKLSSELRHMADWLQAAWYLEVLDSGVLGRGASPAAINTAVTAAKATPSTVGAGAPVVLTLQLLDKVLLLCDQAHGGQAGGGAGVGAGSPGILLEALLLMQQGLTMVQRMAAGAGVGEIISCSDLLHAYFASQLLSQHASWDGLALDVVMSLAEFI